jgi:hypothetical protein
MAKLPYKQMAIDWARNWAGYGVRVYHYGGQSSVSIKHQDRIVTTWFDIDGRTVSKRIDQRQDGSEDTIEQLKEWLNGKE